MATFGILPRAHAGHGVVPLSETFKISLQTSGTGVQPPSGDEICENLRSGGWKTGRQIKQEIEIKTEKSVRIGVFYSTIERLVRQDEIRERKLKEKDIHEFCLTPKGCRQKNKNESVIPKTDFISA